MDKLEALQAKLKLEFEQHNRSEESYAELILPQVVERIWSTEPRVYLSELEVERSRRSKGRLLKTEPDNKVGCVMTGIDEKGRPVYEEEWGSGPESGYKKYFIHTDSFSVSTYNFAKKGHLHEIEFQQSEDGVPAMYGSFAQNKANSFDLYEYEEGFLTKIRSMWVYMNTVQHPTYLAEYDALKNLSQLTRVDERSDFFPEGQNIIVYKKHAYSAKALTDRLVEEYLKWAVTQLEKHSGVKTVLLTIENAFSSDGWLPMKCYFLTEAIDWVQETPFYNLVDVSKLGACLQEVTNSVVLEASALLEQEIVTKELYGQPTKLLTKAGKELKKSLAERYGNEAPVVLVFDVPDGLYLDSKAILRKLYSATEVKKILASGQ